MTSPRRFNICTKAAKCAILAFLFYASAIYVTAIAPAVHPGDQPVEISPVHQPLLLDGTLDQLQQLRIRPMARSCLGGGRLFNDEAYQPLRQNFPLSRKNSTPVLLNRWSMPGFYVCRRSRCRLLARVNRTRTRRTRSGNAVIVASTVVPNPQGGTGL